MDWLSFILGFLAFPLLGAVALGAYAVSRKILARRARLSDLDHVRGGSTLSFSSRLIGEIGESLDSETGPAAKAS